VTYQFRLRVVREGLFSSWSESAVVTTLEPEPVIPQAPTLEVGILDATTVSLSWSTNEAADCFEVQVVDGSTNQVYAVDPFAAGTLSGDITDLTAGTAYQFRIRLICGDTPSEWTTSAWVQMPEAGPDVNDPSHYWGFDTVAGGAVLDGGWCPVDLDVSSQAPSEGVSGEGIQFSGNHRGVVVPDCPSLNTAAVREITISFWFKMDESNERLVTSLYEQGGYWRGLNILIERGWLTASGWNRPAEESDWSGTTIAGGRIPANEWTHVALVLDADEVLSADSLHLYLNGELKGSGPASMLWESNDANGFGQVQGSTSYRNRQARYLHPYQGIIDEAVVWNRALSGSEIETLVLTSFE
jgi:hypothetical protein